MTTCKNRQRGAVCRAGVIACTQTTPRTFLNRSPYIFISRLIEKGCPC
jgi:hypothetical protein